MLGLGECCFNSEVQIKAMPAYYDKQVFCAWGGACLTPNLLVYNGEDAAVMILEVRFQFYVLESACF